MKIYFSDFFDVSPQIIEQYGAFNPSLINDLPLFIDPFLLFNSEKPEYKKLHENIIKYVTFLRDRSNQEGISIGLLKSWFYFPEVKQNWFGYSKIGNGGSGLGAKFARDLNKNLHHVFNTFGTEEITKGSHLEKLCLIKEGVGRDNISDFTTNLIKGYLLEYTENFAKKHLPIIYLQEHFVEHVTFNYPIRRWMSKKFLLPTFHGDYVLLTPKDILTKDEAWINKSDMISCFSDVSNSIENEQLRSQLNEYLVRSLPASHDKKEYSQAVQNLINKYPVYIDYFIRFKEETGSEAISRSDKKVKETENLLINNVTDLSKILLNNTSFYQTNTTSLDEAYQRVIFLKQVIEKNDGYRLFYVDGKPVQREMDLQIIFRLTWHATNFDVNSEVNNGRGSVDYKISKGNADKTLVEFKLASNSKLKQNLKNQVPVYEDANQTTQSIKVILFFTDLELERLLRVFQELQIFQGKNLVIIDARTNKISASNVK